MNGHLTSARLGLKQYGSPGLRFKNGSTAWLMPNSIADIVKRSNLKGLQLSDAEIVRMLEQEHEDDVTYQVRTLWHSKWTKRVDVYIHGVWCHTYDRELIRSTV